MCGISCLVSCGHASGSGSQQLDHEQVDKQIRSGIDAIEHRGPDGRGQWVSDDARVALGHCRLAIIGPDPRGLQPLDHHHGSTDSSSASTTKTRIVVNGELYDFERLRASPLCSDFPFRSDSDSETLLALYSKLGIRDTLPHLRGEFAFVLHDEQRGKLYAVRDRYGVKPMYYGFTAQGQLAVSSEVKGLLAMGCRAKWDLFRAINEGWRLDNGHLLQGVRWVKPGWMLEVDLHTGTIEEKCWYERRFPLISQPETRPVDVLIQGVRDHLIDAIRTRLRSDVPLGVYLSGGVDSSAIAGIIAHLLREKSAEIQTKTGSATGAPAKLKCFSIGFDHPGSEVEIARRTADYIGADFSPLPVTEELLCDHLEEAIVQCELPYVDLGSVAKFLLSRHAKEQGVTVVLTGEGSDEHFAGYPLFLRDRFALEDASGVAGSKVPTPARDSSIYPPRATFWGQETKQLPAELQDKYAVGRLDITRILVSSHHDEGLLPWAQEFKDESYERRLALLNRVLPANAQRALESGSYHPLHSALLLWQNTIFPTQLLTHLGDRVEMAHALEARTPFLDHHLTEFVDSLPPSYKIKLEPPSSASAGAETGDYDKGNVREKWILYEAVKPFITPEVYDRTKQPFIHGARKRPKGGPMHRLLQRLLTREAVERVGWLDYDAIQELIAVGFDDDDDKVSVQQSRLAVAKALLCAQICLFAKHWQVETLTEDKAREAAEAEETKGINDGQVKRVD